MRKIPVFVCLLSGCVLLISLHAEAQVSARGSENDIQWQTLKGNPPLVIAHGGFSGLFPDSSKDAYDFAMMTSVPNVILWCDVQLTKDGAGICFPNVNMVNASSIQNVFRHKGNTYDVNGQSIEGWFSVDFTLAELAKVNLNQGKHWRTDKFDGVLQILTVQYVLKKYNPQGSWLNIQYDEFYANHNLSMRSFVLSTLKSIKIDYISSPEVSFLKSIAPQLKARNTKLIFRVLKPNDIEVSTNQTYSSLLKNLTYIKTLASGILVPKYYIWPVDVELYLQPHTSLVLDAHKEGLEVFASDFANDFVFSYNYSYDPIAEYLSFIDNGNFSVDGVLSDFPLTPSEAIDCFAHLDKNASAQEKPLIISKNGASGDQPGCSDFAYAQAISDGVDILDCPVQMTQDGIPFCFGSIDLMDGTSVARSSLRRLVSNIPEIKNGNGIFTFSMNWSQIQTLRPKILNKQPRYGLLRNPRNKSHGKFLTLSDFLALAKNASSLTGVLISIEHAPYLAEKQDLDVIGEVLAALGTSGHAEQTRIMIQSTNSSVLKKFKDSSKYEMVYKIDEDISDVENTTIEDIKGFADSVIIGKTSVLPEDDDFITGETPIVERLHSFNLTVYVETFSNEFVSQAWDFLSDATVEINTYVKGAKVDGVIADFPKTAARYRKNRCLKMGDKTPCYMSPISTKPGKLLIDAIPVPSSRSAEAPKAVLRPTNIAEPPFPPVKKAPARNGLAIGSPTPACTILFSLGMLVASVGSRLV